MSSSTTLVLVNKVLRMTGSFKQLAAITGSVGGIGERIIEMLNLAMTDIETKANWPELRVNAQGTANGTDDIFLFSGSENVKADGPVSVWIATEDTMEEVTPAQFDKIVAGTTLVGNSQVFQRGSSATGVAQVQIFPVPSSGEVVNMSSYKRATRLDDTTPSAVTEFDDEILVMGAIMHMDLYDQINRGYTKRFNDMLTNRFMSYFSNNAIRVEIDDYI